MILNKLKFREFILYSTLIFAILFQENIYSQTNLVKGSIYDSQGNPLPGVSVVEKNTNNGTTTDFDGLFQLNVSQNSSLIISYIGFASQELMIDSLDEFNIIMQESSEKLDEVVLMGYSSQSRATITSSVVKVNSDELRASSNSNALIALQGKVPGMEVRLTTGQPGQNPQIVIRGGTSTTPNSDGPLYVIDGVLRNNMEMVNANDIDTFQVLKDAAATSIYGARAANGVILITTKTGKISDASYSKIRLNQTLTIETQARKYDWSSARDYLWASRSAANLELDTNTKTRLSSGGSFPYSTGNANFNGRQGKGYGNSTSTTAFLDDLINAEGQAYVANLIDGQGYQTMKDPVTGRTLIFKQNNYQDIMFQTGLSNDTNLSFEGGNEKGSLFASIGAIDQKGILYETDYNMLNFSLNGSYKLRDYLTINSGLNYSSGSFNSNTNSDTDRSAKLPQTVRMYRDNGLPSIGEGSGSPRSILHARKYRKIDRRFSRSTFRIGLDWEIIDGLNFKPSASLYKTDYEYRRFELSNPFVTNRSTQENLRMFDQKSLDLLLSYEKKLLDIHNFNVFVGYNSINEHEYFLEGRGANAATDIITTLAASNQDDERASSTIDNKSSRSWFGKIDYNFDQKYLFSLSHRIDGSSVFAENNKYAQFSAISAGWNVHGESFWSNSIVSNYIDTFKLRLSWGEAGNDNINQTATQGNYSPGNDYAATPGILATTLANQDLVWETTSSLDFGFDMGFGRGNSIFLDIYDKRTKDRLTSYPLPSQTGFNSITSNVGIVQNKGIEIGLDANILRKDDLSWNVGLNYAQNITKVLELPENGNDKNRIGGSSIFDRSKGEYVMVGGLAEGERLGQLYVFQHEGIYQTDAEAALAPTDTKVSGGKRGKPKNAGDSKWLDVDENGVIDDRDLVFIGYSAPDKSGSILNTFKYKNFTFRSVTTFALGHQISDRMRYRANANARNRVATHSDVTNGKIWWGPGMEPYEGYDRTKAIYPRYNAASDWDNGYRNHMRSGPRVAGMWLGPGGGSDSTLYIEDGDYLSFQEISLFYNMPKEISNKLFMENIEVGIAGYNLGFITNYEGLRPEQYDGTERGDYPNPLRVSLTARLTF